MGNSGAVCCANQAAGPGSACRAAAGGKSCCSSDDPQLPEVRWPEPETELGAAIFSPAEAAGAGAGAAEDEEAEPPPGGGRPAGPATPGPWSPELSAGGAQSPERLATGAQSSAERSPPEPGGGRGGGSADYEFLAYEDGSTYIGQLLGTVRQGNGVWRSRTGQYEGQWTADEQHGHGRQTWSDGRSYEGEFCFGKFAGSGRMLWHTPKGTLIYEGQYLDDLKHGRGRFVWADGRFYDGEWVSGKRHGKGTYSNGKETRRGFWEEDKFIRWENREEAAQSERQAQAAAAAAPSGAGAASPAPRGQRPKHVYFTENGSPYTEPSTP